MTNFGQRPNASVQVLVVRSVCRVACGAGLRDCVGCAPQTPVVAEVDQPICTVANPYGVGRGCNLCGCTGLVIRRVTPRAAVSQCAAKNILRAGKQDRVLLRRRCRHRGKYQVVIRLRYNTLSILQGCVINVGAERNGS